MKKCREVIQSNMILLGVCLCLLLLSNCSCNGKYHEAYKIFHSNVPDKHIKALKLIKTIPNRLYNDQVQQLRWKIEKDFVKVKKRELFDKYKDTRIAYLSENKDEVWVRNFNGEHKRRIISQYQNIENIDYLRWSPDGRFLVFSGKKQFKPDSQLYIVNYAENDFKPIIIGDMQVDYAYPSWSGDGEKLIYNKGVSLKLGYAWIASYDIDKGIERVLYPAVGKIKGEKVFYPIWLKNNTDVLVSTEDGIKLLADGQINDEPLYGKDSGGISLQNFFALPGIRDLMLSHDGNYVAFSEGGLKILNLENKSITSIDGGVFPNWSLDNRYLMHYVGKDFQSVTYEGNGIYIGSTDPEEFPDNVAIYLGEGRMPAWAP